MTALDNYSRVQVPLGTFNILKKSFEGNYPEWILVSVEAPTPMSGYCIRIKSRTGDTVIEARDPILRNAFRHLRKEVEQHRFKVEGARICFIGHGRHGKDEAALTLHGQGRFRFYGSTSWAALPEMAEKLGLPEQIAWEKRHEDRQFWKDYCDYLRRDDPCYLIRRVLARGNICSGIRDLVEIQAARDQELFDEFVYIYRPGFPDDPTVTYDPRAFATSTIFNDGTLQDLRHKVASWALQKKFLSGAVVV